MAYPCLQFELNRGRLVQTINYCICIRIFLRTIAKKLVTIIIVTMSICIVKKIPSIKIYCLKKIKIKHVDQEDSPAENV